MAAENHNPNQFFIDIITQSGVGPIRGGGRYSLRDGALAARNPFTPVKGPERLQNYGTNFGGSLLKDRSSFNLHRLDDVAVFRRPAGPRRGCARSTSGSLSISNVTSDSRAVALTTYVWPRKHEEEQERRKATTENTEDTASRQAPMSCAPRRRDLRRTSSAS